MIDNFAILLSTALTVYVALRATKLNRTLPWFERARPKPSASHDPAASQSRPTGLGGPSRIAAVQRALKR